MEEMTKKKSLSLSEIIHDLQVLEDFFKAETGGSVPMCIPEAIKVLNAIKEEMQVTAEKAESKWIPITMRPIEEDEKNDFPDATFMFDCHMPENGEEILITTKYGVEFDTCYEDDGYYLDSDKSWDEVFAWMPLPEAYKKGNDAK